MKRFFVFILIASILALPLVACNQASSVSAPVLSIENDVVSWTTVSGADYYFVRVMFDGLNGYEIPTKETTYKTRFVKEGTYTISVRASVNGKLSKYSNSVNYVLDEGINTTPSGDIIYRGTGTADDPLLVESVGHLLAITTGTRKHVVNDVTEYVPLYYKQTCDLDLEGRDILPLAHGSNKFSGYYDGNGFTISNFTQTKLPDSGYFDMGLFGSMDKAYVINLTIKNFTTNMSYVSKGFTWGAIAGNAENCFIENCHVEGEIKINSPSNSNFYGYVGMIVGKSTGTEFTRCSAKGEIDVTFSKCYVGGIVGVTRIGTKDILTNCLSSVNITTKGTGRDGNDVIATSYAGGLIGYASAFKQVSSSVANATLKATAINGATVDNIGIGIFGGGNSRSSDGLSTLVYTNCYFNYEKLGLSLSEDYPTIEDLIRRFAIGGKTMKQSASTTVFGFTNQNQALQSTFENLDFENVWEIVDGELSLKEYRAEFKQE